MRFFYLLMLVAGVAIPIAILVPWVGAHGLDARLFVSELLGNRVSTFFALDLLLSAIVVIGLALRSRGTVRLWWLPVVITVAVGVSAGLPMLLYLRETARPPMDR